jgi:DNA-binding transcriptional MocR family regulator
VSRPPIDLTGRSPDWPVAAQRLWEQALTDAARERGSWSAPYPEAAGDPALREALADSLRLDPADVFLAAGVRATTIPLARVAEHVLVERPTFAGVVSRFRLTGARVELRPWAELSAAHADLVWVTSPARNPDGAELGAHLVAALEGAARAGTIVVQNEIYSWHAGRARRIAGAILVGSLHKIAGRWSSVGWIAGDALLDRLPLKVLGAGPPRQWQRAWALFWERGGFELLLDGARRAVAARARFEQDTALRGGGPFVLLRLVDGSDEAFAVETLRRHGVAGSAGAHFHCEAPSVRLCFTGVDEDAGALAAERVRRACDHGLELLPLDTRDSVEV